MTYLEYAAHFVVLYVCATNTYFLIKGCQNVNAMTFIENFLYTEGKFDQLMIDIKMAIKEGGNSIENFERDRKLIDRINELKKIIEGYGYKNTNKE